MSVVPRRRGEKRPGPGRPRLNLTRKHPLDAGAPRLHDGHFTLGRMDSPHVPPSGGAGGASCETQGAAPAVAAVRTCPGGGKSPSHRASPSGGPPRRGGILRVSGPARARGFLRRRNRHCAAGGPPAARDHRPGTRCQNSEDRRQGVHRRAAAGGRERRPARPRAIPQTEPRGWEGGRIERCFSARHGTVVWCSSAKEVAPPRSAQGIDDSENLPPQAA